MNISYNWLKEYVDFDLTPDEVAAALTSIGLETGSVEEVQTIKGGLEGLVIGEVLTCEAHPNSDHMHVTTVNLGQGEPVQIVCGAPNVAAGQKVVVATLGTKLYDGDECFTIKKSKLRGVESVGMICAEDEIGIGTDHAGIIVLPETAVPGTLAKDYYNIKSDYVLEVDITPNRADACSHYGVARDLYAYLIQNGKPATLKKPTVDAFAVENHDLDIKVTVENSEACPRYAGVTVKGVTVKESPEWLQNKLRIIGLRPINNVVDITNYINYDMARPLHVFDADKLSGNVTVRMAQESEKFVSLEEKNMPWIAKPWGFAMTKVSNVWAELWAARKKAALLILKMFFWNALCLCRSVLPVPAAVSRLILIPVIVMSAGLIRNPIFWVQIMLYSSLPKFAAAKSANDD